MYRTTTRSKLTSKLHQRRTAISALSCPVVMLCLRSGVPYQQFSQVTTVVCIWAVGPQTQEYFQLATVYDNNIIGSGLAGDLGSKPSCLCGSDKGQLLVTQNHATECNNSCRCLYCTSSYGRCLDCLLRCRWLSSSGRTDAFYFRVSKINIAKSRLDFSLLYRNVVL